MIENTEQATDVSRWRRGERARLIEKRLAVPTRQRPIDSDKVVAHLDHLLKLSVDSIVSLYWPFRGELDLRGWMHQVVKRGARVVLPVAEAKAVPLTFREWTPDVTLIPGVWNIPVPINGQVLDPTLVIAPLVGFDMARYRLGYGGGFFDRTLSAMRARGLQPQVVGIGHSSAAIHTIYPQPHDIPMDVIITEYGIFGDSHADQ